MNHDELIEIIADYAGPLGPFRDVGEQEGAFHAALSSADSDDFDALIQVLVDPPLVATDRALVKGWCFALEEALTIVGARDPQRAVGRLEVVARKQGPARISALSILGNLGETSALDIFGDLVADATLQPSERVALACSLGQIGGHEAANLLQVLGTRSADPAVAKEIDIALESIRTKG